MMHVGRADFAARVSRALVAGRPVESLGQIYTDPEAIERAVEGRMVKIGEDGADRLVILMDGYEN